MKKYIQWITVENFVNEVVREYKNKNVSGVYGLPRGGLVMAVMLSNRLNIPMLNAPTHNCIIVDDICDTGESLVHYAKNSSGQEKNNYHIITLGYKENDLGVIPEKWQFKKEKDWIVFPWEEAEPEGGLF